MFPAAVMSVAVLAAGAAWAQAPREAPREGYGLHDEQALGPFVVQRWVSAESPEVSAAGMCDCIIVVYAGDRRVLTRGTPGLAAAKVSDQSGRDLTGDGSPDLVVSEWSGGAHCCYTTEVYSVGAEVTQVLAVSTGHCGPGEFEDIDGDGVFEFLTCDDGWAYAYCSFADSPLPRVVYAYDPGGRRYVPNTPRFAARLRDELAASLESAQTWLLESGGKDAGLDRCRLLQPALGLMYAGRLEDGVALIRGLYKGADREQFEQETIDRVRRSAHWVPR